MAHAFTVDEFHERLRFMWEQRGLPIPDGERVGVLVADLVEHSRERSTNLALPYVDLWVAILDEHISWFVSLYSVVWSERVKDDPPTNFERSLILILAKCIADMTAIRHLVIVGFDTSARHILRSLSEYLEVLVAIIHQPAFADLFIETDTPGTAKAFWNKHLRDKLQGRLDAAWRDFFSAPGKEIEASDLSSAEWYSKWPRGSNHILSGLLHPCVAGGLFSAIPLKAKQDRNENWLGLWGDKADASVDTIFYLLQYIFPVLLLGGDFPFGLSLPQFRTPHDYDENNELHRHVHVGRSILASIILAVGMKENAPHFFPEIDMSIFQTGENAERPA